MTQHAILTAIGADRPGLVEEVSEFIFQRGGNIEDSRMVNLRGQFAMMVLIGGDESSIGRLRQELQTLTDETTLRAEIHAAQANRAPAGTGAMPYRLIATAVDQAGLVHRIAHVLREQNVNIESMETRLTNAPVTGSPLFEMELIVSIPRESPISKVREKLNRLGDEMNLDCQLTAM